MPAKLKAIIIGSGIAGIACAIRLAVQGFDVSVFEQNDHPGGKLYVLEKDGYRFDTGPSLFVEPENLEALFSFAGEDVHHYMSYEPLEITCKYFYEGGTVINAYSHIKKFAEELQQKTGEPLQHVISYLKESAKIYNQIGKIFLNRSLHKRKMWSSTATLKALASARPGYIFSTLNEANKKKFTTQHAVQLFNRYATYNGSNPYTAPAMLQVISHLELNEGSFYVKGGMISINNALYELALKKGVQFCFNAPVQRIIKTRNKAAGIIVNDKNFFGDAIISNTDTYFTYLQLLNDEYEAKKNQKQERSSSAVVFYWGIKKEFPQLELHNIFFSNDYAAEFKSIFETKKPYSDPTVYINITSKMERAVHAPDGKENWFVMINVPADVSISEQNVISLYKKNILAKLSRMLQTDIELLIETETVLHPKKIQEETGSYSGAIYGASSNSVKAAFIRHPNFSKSIQRLYFAGGSVHPGGGIPLCLKSARITADLVINDSRKWIPDA
jgi:phytoene desaturase